LYLGWYSNNTAATQPSPVPSSIPTLVCLAWSVTSRGFIVTIDSVQARESVLVGTAQDY